MDQATDVADVADFQKDVVAGFFHLCTPISLFLLLQGFSYLKALDASTIHTTTLFLSQAMIHGNICCTKSSLGWLLHEIAPDR
jgi:hypothetical protein